MRWDSRRPLACCGAALAALTALVLWLPHVAPGQLGIGYGVALQRFVLIACLQGAIYAYAVWLIRRKTAPLTLVLGVALALRLMVLVFPPFLSNDMYRYVWDGWVQLAGINPYRFIPSAPQLMFLRDTVIYPNINRATYAHTIYPPAAEMFFAAADLVMRLLQMPPVVGMKLAMLSVECGGMFAMLRLLDIARLPRSRILIYAWNPLPIWEFSSSGHVDAIAVAGIAVALLAAGGGRWGLSAASLAVAVLTKFLPLALAPALWRRGDARAAGIFIGLILLLYAPYLGVGAGVLGFLPGYAAQEGINSGAGIFLADLLHVPAKLYLALLACLLAGLAGAVVWRPASDPQGVAGRAMILASAVLAGLAPHYPWYYAFLLVPACILPRWSSLFLVTASFVLYLNPTHTKLFWPACLFGPFALLAAYDLFAARKPGVAS